MTNLRLFDSKVRFHLQLKSPKTSFGRNKRILPICNNRFLWYGDTPTSTTKNSTRKIKTHIFHFFAKRPTNILHNFVVSFFSDRHHMAQFVKRTNECFSYYHKKKQSQAVENKTKQPTKGYAMSLFGDEIVSQPLVRLSSSGRKCQGCLWRSVMLCKFYKTP